MAKKYKNKTQKEYYKQRNRIERFMRDAGKRGYAFEQNVLPPIPKKITTASVNRLKKLTPEALYKKSIAISPKTGEIVKGTVARSHERELAAQKAAETRKFNALIDEISGFSTPSKTKVPKQTPIEHGFDDGIYTPDEIPDDVYETLTKVREMLSEWMPDSNWTPSLEKAKTHDKNVLQTMLDGAIESEGERSVALRLFKESDRIIELVTNILYASGSREGNFKDGRTQVNADIIAISRIIKGRTLTVEESKDLSELMETMELNN